MPYVEMLRAFVAGEVELAGFERRFKTVYLADIAPLSQLVASAMSEFYRDVEACFEDPSPDAEDFEIGPDELRDRAIALLREGGYEA